MLFGKHSATPPPPHTHITNTSHTICGLHITHMLPQRFVRRMFVLAYPNTTTGSRRAMLFICFKKPNTMKNPDT